MLVGGLAEWRVLRRGAAGEERLEDLAEGLVGPLGVPFPFAIFSQVTTNSLRGKKKKENVRKHSFLRLI